MKSIHLYDEIFRGLLNISYLGKANIFTTLQGNNHERNGWIANEVVWEISRLHSCADGSVRYEESSRHLDT